MSDSRILHRSLRERIGGRWAVSLLGSALLFPVGLILFLLTDDSTQPGVLTDVVMVGIAANLAAGAVLAVASVTVLRNRRRQPAPVWMVVGIGVIAGVIRSAVIGLMLPLLSVPSETPLWSRLILGAMLGGFGIPAVAFLLDVWDQFSAERRHLVTALAQEERQAAGNARYLESLRQSIIVETQQQVDSTLSSVRRRIDTEQLSPGETAALLRDSVDADVRQTSHDLWMDAPRPESRLRLGDVLGLMVATRPFAPEWVVAPNILFGFVMLGRFLSVEGSAITALGYGLYLAVVMITANRLIAHLPGRGTLIFWISMLVLTASGVLVGGLVWLFSQQAQLAITWAVVAAVGGLITVPISGIGPALAQQAEQVLASLRQAISATEIQAKAIQTEADQLQRRVARYLHGTVRADLTAITMRLENAVREGDATASALAMADARELMAVQIDHGLGVPTSSLADEVAALSQRWEGLLEIRTDFAADLALTSGETRSSIDLITEAVHDASRHANARWISVEVRIDNGHVVTRIENDGEHRGGGDPGLGSRSLDELAPGGWQRVRSAHHTTVLTVTMPRHP